MTTELPMRGSAAPGPGRLPLSAGIAAAVAGLSYSSWILEFPLHTKIDVVDGYVSELSATDQHWHRLFSAGDLVTGILVIFTAVSGLVLLRRRPWTVLGWGFLLLFGVSAIGDAVFSMDCAPSMDTSCALRERVGKVSFAHQFHDVTSGLVIMSGIAALLALSVAARRYGWWPVLARWGPVLAAAEACTATATLALMFFGLWLGLAQRVQISILCVGLLVIARALCSRDQAARPAGTDGAVDGPRRERTLAGNSAR